MSLFNDAVIGVPCPACKAPIKQTVAFLRTNDSMDCPSCGATVRLDASEFREGMANADRQIDGIKRAIRKTARDLRR